MDDLVNRQFAEAVGPLSAEMMVSVMNQSQDCIKVLDTAGRLLFMNRNGRCNMEIDDFCTVERQDWWSLWPSESASLVEQSVHDAMDGKSSRFEAFCPTAKGTPKWWDVGVSPVRNAQGDVFAIVSISRDVTHKVKSTEALDTMAREMRHRLRNAFAISGAVAIASTRNDPMARPVGDVLAQRYSNLARAQSGLLDAGGHCQNLAALVLSICDAFDIEAKRFQIGNLPEVEIDEQNSRLVALIIGELCTNSLKYGALNHGGKIDIEGKLEPERLTLRWVEDTNLQSVSLDQLKSESGTSLMMRMAQAYGGSLDMAADGGSVSVSLTIPFRQPELQS